MTVRITQDELMRFLDGELSPGEHARVEAALAGSTELTRDLALYRALKEDLQGLAFRNGGGGRSVWSAVQRRLARPIGWILLVAGTVVWAVYGSYLFVTSPVDLWEKLATGAIVIGILLLLASVIWERYADWLVDPYRDVRR